MVKKITTDLRGGISVKYSDCWDEKCLHPYYTELLDKKENRDLPINLENYILTKPNDYFCSAEPRMPKGFEYAEKYFRWKKITTQKTISENLKVKKDKCGPITNIKILKRTKSFRVVKIKIEYSNKNYIIDGELNIRQILSTSTLPSAAFILEKGRDRWKIFGAGWGHGVGMCQIGAAKMSEIGYNYKEIIDFYFPNTKIKKMGYKKKVELIMLNIKRPCYDIANCYELKKCIYGENGKGPKNCNGNPKKR